ncbi:MAG: MMPL family transporter, partial [Hyphomicrobiales bacterium]|nr:MMPL family transporter [Hyphomicrobiales bacterium]
IALSSLLFVSRPAITRFGLTAASGTAIACVVVLTFVPALARFMLRNSKAEDGAVEKSGLPKLVADIAFAAARSVTRYPTQWAISGVLLLGLCGFFYALNTPQFRYGANLPLGTEVQQAAERIDDRLAGWNTLRLYIKWPGAPERISDGMLAVVAEAHAVLQSEKDLKEVWSLQSVAEWFEAAGRTEAEFRTHIDEVGPDLYGRLVSSPPRTALITANMPDLEAGDLLAMVARLESRLDTLRHAHPGVEFHLTGITLQSARAAHEMIGLLNYSLLMAISVIIVLIGISLRSVAASALAVLPNLFPIAVAGTYLYFTGRGLQFTSIIIFTIGFGIAVDSTIHVLNHYHRTAESLSSWAAALHRTITRIGPALIVSTLALMAGGVTMLSPLPMAQLYGRLTLIVLTAALIGDLLLLPALIAVAERWRRRDRVL